MNEKISALNKAIETMKAAGLDSSKLESQLKKLEKDLHQGEAQALKDKAIQEQQIRVEEKKLEAIEIAGNDKSYLENPSKLRRLAIDTVGSVGHVVSERDLSDIRQGATEFFYNEHDFFDGIDHTPVSIVDCLEALKDVAWTVHVDSIPTFVKEMFLLNLYIHYNGKYGDDSNLFITSAVERNGKSWLRHSIVEAYKRIGVSVGRGSWPKGEHSNVQPYSSNLIVEIDDTSADSIKNINEDQMKAILRKDENSYIPMNLKNQQPVNIKSRAKVMASGNTNPPLGDDSTWRVIYTNSLPVVEALKIPALAEIIPSKDTIPELVAHRLPETAMETLSLILGKMGKMGKGGNIEINDENQKDVNRRLIELSSDLPLLPQLIELVKNLACRMEAEAIHVMELLKQNGERNYGYAIKLAKTIRTLNRLGIVKPVDPKFGKGTHKEEYKKWNLSALYDVDIDYATVERSLEDEVLDARNYWNELIEIAKEIEGDNPTPPMPPKSDEDSNNEELSTEDELSSMIDEAEEGDFDDLFNELNELTETKRATYDYIEEPKHSYKDRYTTYPTDNSNDEYETINPIKEGERRSDENVVSMRNFVLEMDDVPKEEQKEIARKLVNEHIVNRIVDSGNKSIHFRITVANEIRTKEEYKAIHAYLNNTYFNGKADTKCSNPSRFTRKLNGYRPDKQKRQKGAVFGNYLIDVSEQLRAFEAAKQLEDTIKAMRKELKANNSPKRKATIRETIENWKDSETKESIIAVLNGYGTYDQDLFRALSAIKWAGFEYDEVVAEIDFGKWNIRREFYDKLNVSDE